MMIEMSEYNHNDDVNNNRCKDSHDNYNLQLFLKF